LGGSLSLKVGGFALVWLVRAVLGLFCFCFLQVLRVEWRVCASWVPLLYLKGLLVWSINSSMDHFQNGALVKFFLG